MRRNSTRRLSQAFLSACLTNGDSDSDFFSVCCSEEGFESLPSSPRVGAARYCFSDSEGDDDCNDPTADGSSLEEMFKFEDFSFEAEGQDLEDMYEFDNFDLVKVAAALNRGATAEELVNVIEQSMADELEASTAEADQLPEELGSHECSPLMAGDLSGRMTPPSFEVGFSPLMAGDLAGRMTPPNTICKDPADAAAWAGRTPECSPVKLEGLADRLAAVVTASPARGRRASAVQSRRLTVAVKEACTRHRQSLTQAAAQELMQAQQAAATVKDGNVNEVAAEIRHVVCSADRQRRRSIMKAAEVLEVAGFGEDSGEDSAGGECLVPSEVTAKLQLVQEAVAKARQRHRQSISHAVRSMGNVREEEQEEDTDSVRARVARTIAAAYARHEHNGGDQNCQSGQLQRSLALMRTRTSVVGRPVHCGPRSRHVSPRKAKRGGPGGA